MLAAPVRASNPGQRKGLDIHQGTIAFGRTENAQEQKLDTVAGKSARAIVEHGISAARGLASSVETGRRLAFARTVVHKAVCSYWTATSAPVARSGWPLRELPHSIELGSCSEQARELAADIGGAASLLDPADANYRFGLLYTAMIPRAFRARMGAYYTPPALCDRLLEMVADAGVDWTKARVLDPACGGGAFLAPVARRMARSLNGPADGAAFRDIGTRLVGLEADPFAAWMSQVFVEATLGESCGRIGPRLPVVVQVCDSLEQDVAGEEFDLVVGNPPYGRVKLPPRLRSKFARSLFGHANLYGVFTDLALRFTRPGGLIAYVTPTSFLAGEYFKALRGLLAEEAPPIGVEFVGDRKGVFADVLQETLLAVYRRGGSAAPGRVYFNAPKANEIVGTTSGRSFRLPRTPDKPWLLPRTPAQCDLLRRVVASTTRLADLGYTVSTGPLVWNRHKDSLRDRPGPGHYPLLWAESVRSDGTFEFRAAKRNRKPYFQPTPAEHWVVTNEPCVLLQRTTAKEQCRRLIAAELPASFIAEHGAVVVENHLNMIRPRSAAPEVTPAALVAVLNSEVTDQVFRCINGSVAVSAYELHALPLPSAQALQPVERLVASGVGGEPLERAVARAYGQANA